VPAADDGFVSLATWLARDPVPPPSAPERAVTPPAAREQPELEAFARELRLLRARLCDVEDALGARE
jgi:hypothetical protein